MHNLIRLAGLLILGLALIVPSFAGEEKKAKGDEVGKAKGDAKKDDFGDDIKEDKKNPKKTPKKTSPKKEEKKTSTARANFMGKLTQMDANSQRDFTVQVTVYEPNPDGFNRVAQLQNQLLQQQQQFLRLGPRDFQGRQNTANAIRNTQFEIVKAQQPQNLYKPKHVDVKLRATDDMKVRWNYPPPDYDDKGNLKKYTKDELKALRGDEGLPGYKGEMDALRQGQMVAVYLLQKNALKGLNTGKGPPKGGKKITEDDEVGLRDRHEVKMIMILSEPKQQ
jgi:hypothetical protein